MLDRSSVSSWVERQQSRSGMSRRESEQRVIEDKREEIARLSSKAGLFKSREKRKVDEEVAYTLPLSCWGFGR